MQNKQRLNITALICSIIMIVSCFLPWAEVSSSVSAMGYSSSLKANAIGIESGIGIIACLLGLCCLTLVLIRNRFMIIPGILNFIFSYMQGISMEEISSTVSTNIGSGYAGTSYGIYVLIISCLVYVIITAFALFRATRKNKTAHNTIPDSVKSEDTNQNINSNSINKDIKPKAVHSIMPKSKFLSRFTKVLIVLGAVVGLYVLIFSWIERKSEKLQREQAERESLEYSRIQVIVEKVKEEIEAKKYDAALINAQTIIWGGDPYSFYKSHYETIKNDFLHTINDLASKQKKDDELAVQKAYLAAIANETDGPGEEPPGFPFEMVVSADKTYLYSEPNVNSERKDSLEKNAVVKVMATQNDFHFCKFKVGDTSKSGWIFYSEIERIK